MLAIIICSLQWLTRSASACRDRTACRLNVYSSGMLDSFNLSSQQARIDREEFIIRRLGLIWFVSLNHVRCINFDNTDCFKHVGMCSPLCHAYALSYFFPTCDLTSAVWIGHSLVYRLLWLLASFNHNRSTTPYPQALIQAQLSNTRSKSPQSWYPKTVSHKWKNSSHSLTVFLPLLAPTCTFSLAQSSERVGA